MTYLSGIFFKEGFLLKRLKSFILLVKYPCIFLSRVNNYKKVCLSFYSLVWTIPIHLLLHHKSSKTDVRKD